MLKDKVEVIAADLLIVGSGIAGLSAALEASKRGKKVLLVSKSPLGKANNTYLAGGFFSVAHGDFNENIHFKKTIQSGRGLNQRALVTKFVSEAPRVIEDLHKLGMEGKFQIGGFRVRESPLFGGPGINSVLLRACRGAGVKFLEGVIIADLLVHDQTCHGAIGFHKRNGTVYGFKSRAVLLATGGAGAIYAQHDNAPGMTGDGYALGMQAGLELIDMEFVQFYPLVHMRSGKARMIVPVRFADAGKIINRQGQDLKEKYGLFEKPVALVARDRLSQALFKELLQGNDVDGAMLLDLTKADEKNIADEEDLREKYIKIFSYHSKPIRIAPACHFTMGGIVIDESCRTSIRNLFAAGEVVGGIHGANRMGGNALSEALVYGISAARAAVETLDSGQSPEEFELLARRKAEEIFISRWSTGVHSNAAALMELLRQSLWRDVGIVRSENSLKKALLVIDHIVRELGNERAGTPIELSRILECRNAALTGRSIALAAITREESRGSHYREDFAVENEAWLKNIYVGLVEGLPNITRILPIPE